MKGFDRKFGEDFVAGLPTTPAVYFIYDETDQLIYIGKAKNLRRRMGQYRNAKRRKKHAKMKAIVADAARISFQACDSDYEACLLEARLIQEKRPKWNVEGAFYFLYPMIGILHERDNLRLCYTTEPERFPGYEFHGAYRSRWLTREAFFAWIDLLGYVGHRVRESRKKRLEARVRYSYSYGFRQLPPESIEGWKLFLKGESRSAVEKLILDLVENAGARKNAKAVQDSINSLLRFWRHEASVLRKACAQAQFTEYSVSQRQRDLIFIHARHTRAQKKNSERVLTSPQAL